MIARAATAAFLLGLVACTSGDGTPATNDTGTKFKVLGNDMSASSQNVYISVNGAAKPGLTVTVNGTVLDDVGAGQYSGRLTTTAPAGGAVALSVTDGSSTASATGNVPETPVVSSATIASPGAPVVITWSSVTSPDSFAVAVNYHLPDSSAAAVYTRVAGSLRQASLAQTDIPANGVVYSISLDALVGGTFSGAAASGSSMNLRAIAPSYPFTIP